MGLFSKDGWLGKLAGGLSKTKDNIAGKIENLIKYYREIDDDFFEELEMILISADVGVSATEKIIGDLRARVKDEKIGDSEKIYEILRESMADILIKANKKEDKPFPML